MSGSGLLPCKLTPNPVSPVANPCCNCKNQVAQFGPWGKAMRRRDFIGIVGSAAAWPLIAHAQQTAMPVIGFLHLTSPETNRENLATFLRGLADTGYIEGKNVTIEYRWAQGQNDQL